MTDKTIGYQEDQQPSPPVDYFYLARRVARIFALPINPEQWSEEQTQEVNDIILEGLRMFYSPPIVDAFGVHTWSFMNPTTKLNTIADQRWYALPFDFDHMDPDATFTYSESSAYPPIHLTSESRLRKLDFGAEYTAYPRYAALRIQPSNGEVMERWEVGFFPTPDASYELEYSYHAVAHPISRHRPYPTGAATHGQVILAAVEAAAEMYEHDGEGPRYKRYMEQLKTEIEKDSKRTAKIIGYAGNGRFWRGPGRRSDLCYMKPVTYNGSQYLGP